MPVVFNSIVTKAQRKTLRKKATVHEQILWARLKGKQLGVKFRRQQAIGKYVVDFYCAEKKLVIELDGNQHGEHKEYDDERTKYLESQGLKVLRFWDGEVNKDLANVILKIEEYL